MLAEGSTRQAISDISRFFSKSKIQHDAMEDERTRLARDLHDGVLQALTGIALQLEAASKLIATDPDGARARIVAIGDLIAAEQRELRGFVHRLKHGIGASLASPEELATALHKLRERAVQLGGVRVDLAIDGHGSVPRSTGDAIYRVVQEALTNVVRHAHAQSARVQVMIRFDKVRIRVSDDGCGFPFRGEHNLASLAARNWGPKSLRERVAALRGELLLTSSLSGSSLDICLPIDQPALDGFHARAGEPGIAANPRRR
jgi:signal transduction histidine kinase